MIAELGYHLAPYIVIWLISDLAKNNITTLESIYYEQVLSHFLLQIHYADFYFYFYFSQLPNTVLTRMKEVMNNPDNLSIAPIDVVEEVSESNNVYIFFFFLLSFRFSRNVDWWRMHSRNGCRTNCDMLQGSECPW